MYFLFFRFFKTSYGVVEEEEDGCFLGEVFRDKCINVGKLRRMKYINLYENIIL